MFKLTMEFKSMQELVAFVNSQNLGATAMDIQDVHVAKDTPSGQLPPHKESAEVIKPEPMKAEVKAKKGSKKKAETVEVDPDLEDMEEVESPFADKPPVIEVPKERAPQTAPFDHAAGVQKAISLIGKLKASGIPDSQHMPIAHEVYAQAGIPLATKISQFSNEQLQSFLPLFEQKVESLTSKTDTTSFI